MKHHGFSGEIEQLDFLPVHVGKGHVGHFNAVVLLSLIGLHGRGMVARQLAISIIGKRQQHHKAKQQQ